MADDRYRREGLRPEGRGWNQGWGNDHRDDDRRGGWSDEYYRDDHSRSGLYDRHQPGYGSRDWSGGSDRYGAVAHRDVSRGNYYRDEGNYGDYPASSGRYGRYSGASRSSRGRGDYGRDNPSAGGYGYEGGYTGGYGYAGGSTAGYGSDPQRSDLYAGSRGRDWNRGSQGEERGFFERAGDEVRSWFGDEDAQSRRTMDQYRGRGPRDYTRSDDRIREDANDRLTDDWSVDASDVTVSVDKGEVTLSGTVSDRRAKRCAEDCVEDVSGVKHVQNNLRIAPTTGSTQGAANATTTGASTTATRSSAASTRA